MPLLKNLISLLIVCDGGCHPSPNLSLWERDNFALSPKGEG